MEKIKIAEIVNVVGIKGEVKLYNYSDRRERFEELDELLISKPGGEDAVYRIEKVGYRGASVILKLKGVNDRNSAELLKGSEVYIGEDKLMELPEDTYYLRELIGMRVRDEGESGEIGVLKDVIQNSAQDIYAVETADGRVVLIPAVKSFIRSVDRENRLITTSLIPGFIDDPSEA